MTQVSIHVPARGTTVAVAPCNKSRSRFQSTFPQGERLSLSLHAIKAEVGFNPRSRKGNDHKGLRCHWCQQMFQSTFPQGERQGCTLMQWLQHGVSIHVPARGTTTVSTPQLVHRKSFNPRSRKGNDAVLEELKIFLCGFNPRSRKGNDAGKAQTPGGQLWFQSTFPQGERPAIGRLANPCRGFNPRSRKGNDQDVRKFLVRNFTVSIHVPARGTTTAKTNIVKNMEFQSTFPQGERHVTKESIYLLACFNPRSRKGNDIPLRRHKPSFLVSIHVPARGTTMTSYTNAQEQNSFNPRSRKGNDGVCTAYKYSDGNCFNPRSRKGNDKNLFYMV